MSLFLYNDWAWIWNYVVKLLTFVKWKFLQWNARDTSLVWIDVVKEIMLNCEIIDGLLLDLFNIMHEIVMFVTIKVLCLCVFALIGKLLNKILFN